jgi:hypothetical protein
LAFDDVFLKCAAIRVAQYARREPSNRHRQIAARVPLPQQVSRIHQAQPANFKGFCHTAAISG